MSVEDRRDSLRKSSIGIDSIRKSITSLGEGLRAIAVNSQELLKQTRETNQLKRKFIKQDAEFFKRRRENALRKQREDELEASTITGVTKRQGSLVQKSTRGFLGRILDFVGILILGWAITNLPKIIAAFQKLFGFIKRTVGILSGFVEGMKNFLLSLGAGIENFLAIFNRFDFREDDKNIKDTFEKTQNNLSKLERDFVESVNAFATDKDINSANEEVERLGITEENKDDSGGVDTSQPKSNDEIVGQIEREVSQEQVDAINEGGRIDEEGNVFDAEGNIVEGVEAGAADLTLTDEDARQQIESEDAIQGDQTTTDATGDNIEGTQTFDDEEVTGDADDVEGMGGDDEQILSSGSGSSGGAPSLGGGASGGGSLDVDEDEGSGDKMVNPPGKKDQSMSVKPIKRNFFNLFGRRKKKTTVVQVNNQGGGNTPPPIQQSSDGKTKFIKVGQSTEKTLLDLQSLNNKHN